jgi:hypothetical protein
MIIKILKFIFITLGVIFFILIIAAATFIIIDPFNLRSLLSDFETIGVDIKNLPTELTPTMVDCFTRTLGEKRAKEIAGGALPNLDDISKAKDCLAK